MNCAYVEDYKSDVSCSSEDDFQPKPKKARRADREWHKIREFQSSEDGCKIEKNGKVLKTNEEDSDCIKFFTNCSSIPEQISVSTVKRYKDSLGSWDTFEEFMQIYYGTWKVTLNSTALEKSLCTCPYFSKHLTCKHVLGMQIRLKLVEPPPESKNVSMGQKRKRGRPSKAKAALLI